MRPYQVRIGVLPLTTAQWRRVMEQLASQALFRAKLLAGEMPHEIEEVFGECGTPLFPRSAADLDMHCSCPDWGVPCKHLAAVCYVLAEEFDRDPFAMLAWRGKGRDELLTALRQIQGGPPPDPAGRRDQLRRRSGRAGPTLAECLDGFWSPGLSPARLRALAAAPGSAAPTCCCACFRRRPSRSGEGPGRRAGPRLPAARRGRHEPGLPVNGLLWAHPRRIMRSATRRARQIVVPGA